MKKILYYCLGFVISVGLFSCSKDEEIDIEGFWDIYFVEVKNCDDPEDDYTIDLSEGPCIMDNGLEVCVSISYNFSSDGELTIASETMALGTTDSDTETYNYTLDEDSFIACDDSGCDHIDYSITGDEIQFTWLDDDDGCELTVRGRR